MDLGVRKSLICLGSIASPLAALATGVAAEASAPSGPAIEWSHDAIAPALHQLMIVAIQPVVYNSL